MRWDAKDEQYVYTHRDWDAFQAYLKKQGFAYEGSADYAAEGGGLTGTNFWKKDGLSIEEGEVGGSKTECFVKESEGLSTL